MCNIIHKFHTEPFKFHNILLFYFSFKFHLCFSLVLVSFFFKIFTPNISNFTTSLYYIFLSNFIYIFLIDIFYLKYFIKLKFVFNSILLKFFNMLNLILIILITIYFYLRSFLKLIIFTISSSIFLMLFFLL
jgi:hypothetical protein